MPTTAIEIIERHAHAGTWWLDPDSEELWWSEGIYRLYGLDPAHYTPSLEDALTYLTPESRGRIQAAIQQAVETGVGWNLQVNMRRADGVLRHMQAVGNAEPRPGRSPLLAGAFFDVHEEIEARERRRALERQLAEQALRWQTAGENAGMGLIEIDFSANEYRLSGSFASRAGFVTNENEVRLARSVWLELVDERDREERQQKMEAHLQGRTATYDCEYRLRLPERDPIWIHETGKMLPDDSRIIGTLIDISARKQAERALRQSQRRLQQTLRNAPIGIALVSPEGRWLTVNQALCDMIGYDELELMSLTFQELTHPDDLEADLGQVQDLLAGRTLGYRLEKRYFHKRGHMVDIQLDVSLLRDDAGEPLYFISQIQDITQRKREHRELFEANELAEITFEAIGEGVVRMDRHGVIQQVNPAACQLLGRTADSMLHHGFTDTVVFYHPEVEQPIDNPLPPILMNGGRAQIPLFTRLLHQDGHLISIADSLSAIHDEDGEIQGAVFVFQDISEARRRTEELTHQASHDTLTGLPNRRGFQRELATTWERVRGGMLRAFVMYLDLDHFKAVNDNCGHAAGDELLRRIAAELRGLLRESDVLARLGGDEFAAVVHARDAAGARVVADKFIRCVRELAFVHAGRTYHVGLSVGIAALDTTQDSSEVSLARADTALYEAKAAGRNGYRLFEAGMSKDSPDDAAELLRRGLEGNAFDLYLQAIVDGNGKPVGHEALLRFIPDDGSPVMDVAEFLPAARRLGLTSRLDQWGVARALELLACRPRSTDTPDALYFSVSLSPLSLADPQFHAALLQRLDRHPDSARRLVFEIAESDTLHGPYYPRLIAELRQRGFRVWLDDFGNGRNAFDLLKQVAVDGIKINAAFVRSLLDDTINRAVLRAIIDVSTSHGLEIVAEGVENEAVFQLLHKANVARFQGSYFQLPEPAAALVTLPAASHRASASPTHGRPD